MCKTYFYINVHAEQVLLYDRMYYFNSNTCKYSLRFIAFYLQSVLPWALTLFCDVIQLLLVKSGYKFFLRVHK